jgi:RNA polymerase sigma factor (sigma-70 family)
VPDYPIPLNHLAPYNIRTPSFVYNHKRSKTGADENRRSEMHDAASLDRMTLEQDRRISDVVTREQSRLRNFIRRRVPDPGDAEDILQEVFYELIEANRLLMPIQHVTGWLFQVARNRITDLFRKKKPESFSDAAVAHRKDDDELLRLDDLLPSPDAGPEALYARRVLLDELESAVEELPDEQREVFIAHELEGRTFKEMSAATGVSINTLLSRKRYAVLHLRERLKSVYDEFTKA